MTQSRGYDHPLPLIRSSSSSLIQGREPQRHGQDRDRVLIQRLHVRGPRARRVGHHVHDRPNAN
jgi:hypothetical protein